MNTIVMWIGGLLITVLTALFAVPHFVDWNGYRGVLEEEASRVLGRDVRVGGKVNLRLLPVPYVRFENLRIADTSGIAGAPMFQAGSFTMWLSVPPLLKGVLEAREIELEKPQLRLASDSSGRGNWHDLHMQRGSLPFVPAGVTLQSVRIVDGTIGFDLQDSGTLAEITGLNGELTARDITGPFIFQGTGTVGGREREIRFATSEPSDNGQFRVKGSFRSPDNTGLYSLDGLVEGLNDVPSLTGTLSARLRTRDGLGAPEAEIRSEITASTTTTALENIVVSFEEVGPPQLLTGSMSAAWGARHRIVLDMSSRWLDLDRLVGGAPPSPAVPVPSASPTDQAQDGPAGREAAPTPIELASQQATGGSFQRPLATAQQIFGALIDMLPEKADLDAKLGIEQINLGGDAVSGVQLAIVGSGGPLELRTLRASLPGGARLDFTGRLEAVDAGPVFAGQLFLGGPSVARLLTWAANAPPPSSLSDGPFSVAGELSLGARSIDLLRAAAEFSGSSVTGGLKWRDGKKPRLDLEMEGHEIDTRWVGVSDLDLSGLLANFAGARAGLGAVSPADADRNATAAQPVPNSQSAGDNSTNGIGASVASLLSSADQTMSFKIRAGRLRDGVQALSDVDAELQFSDGKLDIPALRFSTEDGLAVQASADLQFVDGAPRGALKWTVDAKTAQAARTFADLALDADSSAKGAVNPFEERLAGLAPFRLAGRLDMGARSAASADLTVDGVIRGRRATGQFLFDKGLAAWRSSNADMLVTIDADDIHPLIAVVSGSATTLSGDGEVRPGRGVFKASGVADEGMLALAELQAEGLKLGFEGRIGVAAETGDGTIALENGEIQVVAADARDVLRLVGLSVGAGAAGTRLQGSIDFIRNSDALVLQLRDVAIANSRVAGRVSLSGDGRGAIGSIGASRQIAADLTLDQVALADLLTGLSRQAPITAPVPAEASRDGGEAGQAASQASGTERAGRFSGLGFAKSPFSDAAFDLDALSAVSGDIVLRVGALAVGNGVSIPQAVMTVKSSGGDIDVGITSDKLLGGRMSWQIALAGAAAGVDVNSTFVMQAVELAALMPADKSDAAAGRVDIEATFTGRALSARALIAVIAGEGQMRLVDARVRGLSPDGIKAVADAVLNGETDGNDEEFNAAVLQGLMKGQLSIGSRSVPIKIVDGQAKFADVEISGDLGATRANIVIDLAALRADSLWQIVASGGEDARQPWPPVNVAFSGSLAKVGAMAPKISADALQRELTVRQMERNVEELERLRQLDEDAASKAREREAQRALEEARERAEAAAAAEEAARALGPLPLPGQPTDAPVEGVGGEIKVEELPPPVVDAKPTYSPPPRRKSRPVKRPADTYQQIFGGN